ncbi:MAG: hypothetical protein J7M24_01225, partial [Candidatus Latescibacteria bacterium]|nr:hypothetical protein [Candidatus Latescibacterota bacterium]
WNRGISSHSGGLPGVMRAWETVRAPPSTWKPPEGSPAERMRTGTPRAFGILGMAAGRNDDRV